MKKVMSVAVVLCLVFCLTAYAKPKRKLPKAFKHKGVGRCLDHEKKWIRGCK